MSEHAAPSYRLKLPCANEREFREKFQQKYVTRGIFVPSEKPRSVGTRLRLKLEIRDGTVLVSGDGMVTSVAKPGEAAKPGMTVRLTALHAESIQFPLSPSAGGAPPAGPALSPPPVARPPPIPAHTPAPAAPPPGATPAPSFARASAQDDLFDLDEAPPADAAHATPDDGVSAVTDPAIPIPAEFLQPEEAAPEPSPPPSPAAAPAAGPRRPGRRLVIGVAAVALVVLGVGAASVVASRGARERRALDARLAEQLRIADLRLLEGRLAASAGDSALDHLLEAKGMAPADERVVTRLKLLADKFEQLGDRALARKNVREAAVHFKATLLADPLRANARAKLDGIEVKDPRAGARR